MIIIINLVCFERSNHFNGFKEIIIKSVNSKKHMINTMFLLKKIGKFKIKNKMLRLF